MHARTHACSAHKTTAGIVPLSHATMWILELTLRSSDLHARHLYPRSCLASLKLLGLGEFALCVFILKEVISLQGPEVNRTA